MEIISSHTSHGFRKGARSSRVLHCNNCTDKRTSMDKGAEAKIEDMNNEAVHMETQKWNNLRNLSPEDWSICAEELWGKMNIALQNHTTIPIQVEMTKENLNNEAMWDCVIRQEYTLVMKLLLDLGLPIDTAFNDKYNTPLFHKAAELGCIEIAKTLLNHASSDVNGFMYSRDSYDRTALMVASEHGKIDMVRFFLGLLENNIKISKYVNAPNCNGLSAIFWAARFGHHEIVELLLASGADINAWDKTGATLLISAARFGRYSVVQLLLQKFDKHERVRFVNTVAPRYHETALLAAADKGHLEVLHLLLKSGGDLNVNHRNPMGKTALLYAANWEAPETIRLLIKAGAKVTTADDRGETVLMKASKEGCAFVVQVVLDWFENKFALAMYINRVDNEGRSAIAMAAIAMAAIGHHAEVIKKLIIIPGVDVMAKDNEGSTPLLLAARHGSKAVIEVLLNWIGGLDMEEAEKVEMVNMRNNKGESAMSWAMGYNHVGIIQLLVNSGGRLDV